MGLGPWPTAEAAELKIGYVNMAKLFDSYERTKASDADLQRKGKQKDGELQGRISELKKLREGLELLNDQARDAKNREIEQKADDLQRFRNTTARDLRRERDRAAKEILTDIQRAVEAYAKANSFSLIVDERALLFGQSAYDVTDDVLKQLNGQAAAAAAPTGR